MFFEKGKPMKSVKTNSIQKNSFTLPHIESKQSIKNIQTEQSNFKEVSKFSLQKNTILGEIYEEEKPFFHNFKLKKNALDKKDNNNSNNKDKEIIHHYGSLINVNKKKVLIF